MGTTMQASATTLSPKKQGRFDSLEQEAYLSLWRTYDRLRAIEDDLFKPFKLTPQQYNVMRLLRASEEPIPTLSLAERLVSHAPDITRMIDRLAARGLVTRHRSESDRRAVLIALTEEGRQLLEEIAEPLRACHEQQFGHVPEKRLKQLVKLLAEVRRVHEKSNSPWRV